MAHLMDNSGINYNEDYDLTYHGASLDKDELDRLLHCPECGEMMGPGGKPLTFSDAHMQWAHKACWEDAQRLAEINEANKRSGLPPLSMD